MDRQTKAYLYAGATVLLWSTVASAFKLTLAHLSNTLNEAMAQQKKKTRYPVKRYPCFWN